MNNFDIIIIGSGCGGAPAAGILASSGAKVCVLERGNWWGPLQGKNAFPKNLTEFIKSTRGVGLSFPLLKKYINLNRESGLFEFYFVMNGYIVIIPSGVGGGSLLVGGFIDKPPEDYFHHFPDEITMKEMDKHYEQVAEIVEPSVAPKDTLYNKIILEACKNINGITSNPMHTGIWFGNGPESDESRVNAFGCIQKNCNYQAHCFTGCNRNAKNSMDITYLQLLLKNSGEIRELSEAVMIHKKSNQYSVDYFDIKNGKMNVVTAPKLIIATGAMNTMRLLFSSRNNKTDGLVKISDQLGKKWGFNGDMLGFKLLRNKKIDHKYGTSLFRYHEIESDSYQFDFHQFAFRSSLLSWLPWPLHGFGARLMPFLSLSREEPIGTITPDGEVMKIVYPAQKGHNNADMAQKRVALEVDSLSKCSSERQLSKKIEKTKMKKGLGSVHPTGGAVMAQSMNGGVVNHAGEVFNYPGLYISDASILPAGTCCGPHFTIMALSDRISRLIIEKEK